MKIVLIFPRANPWRGTKVKNYMVPPYGLQLLAALTPPQHEVILPGTCVRPGPSGGRCVRWLKLSWLQSRNFEIVTNWLVSKLSLDTQLHCETLFRNEVNLLVNQIVRQTLFFRPQKMEKQPMNDITKRFLWVSAYAIAMALLEAVVVVYIRGLLQITNEHVALGSYVTMEIWREAATLVMLVAVGWLAGRQKLDRLAYGLFAFGLWDIWYYIWLKVLIDWPQSLLDWDTLFLIPLTWWGPVLSPVLIAALMCVTAVLAVVRLGRGERLKITLVRVSIVLLGGLLALYVFMSDSFHAWLAGQSDYDTLRPTPFQWPLFLAAFALMAWPSLRTVWPKHSDTGQTSWAKLKP